MGRHPSRERILRQGGVADAPRDVQEEFWRRYNFVPWRRRLPAALGDLLAKAWPESAGQKSGLLDRVEAAWLRALPAEYADLTKVEGLTGGRLRILVDSAATRFVLERQLGGVLVAAVNEAMGTQDVGRIEYQLGRMSGRRMSGRRKSNDSNKKKISKERQ